MCSVMPALWASARKNSSVSSVSKVPTFSAGMARSYTGNYANRNLDYGEELISGLIKDFSVEGVVFHSNRSCKLMDFRSFEVQRRITDKMGIPSVMFDGDQTDPRVFSEAQYETRIQALVEMMEKNKELKRRGDL